MKKLIIYYNFILVSIMILSSFLSAHFLPQLVSAIIFYPLLIHFSLLVVPRKQKAIAIKELLPPKEKPPLEKVSFDKERRTFLKLIGSAGLSLFMISLFTKKTHAAFFGSIPGPGTVSLKDTSGTPIDPAEKSPLDGYAITEIDDGTPSYFGYVNKDGAWYILKEDTNTGSYRYAKGSSNFSGNWQTKESLEYGYFDSIF